MIHDENLYYPFYFHPDHLGSSSYISNMNGRISQHNLPRISCGVEYFPFGETLVEEHKNSNNSPYKFNGKELDDETGNYYYGARYYNPQWSIWLSVDPLVEKYPAYSPYNYTVNNPVNYTDPDGREIDVTALKKEDSKQSKWLLNNLKSNLSKISGQDISVKKVGERYILEGDGPCKANCTKASAYIDYLLNGKDVLEVHGTKTGSETFPWGKMFLDAAQIKSVQNELIKIGLNPETLNVGFGFLYESLHTRFGLSFFEEDSEEFTNYEMTHNDSEILDRINEFRQEMNGDFPLRVDYYNNKFPFIFKDKNGNRYPIKNDKTKVKFKSPRDL